MACTWRRLGRRRFEHYSAIGSRSLPGVRTTVCGWERIQCTGCMWSIRIFMHTSQENLWHLFITRLSLRSRSLVCRPAPHMLHCNGKDNGYWSRWRFDRCCFITHISASLSLNDSEKCRRRNPNPAAWPRNAIATSDVLNSQLSSLFAMKMTLKILKSMPFRVHSTHRCACYHWNTRKKSAAH